MFRHSRQKLRLAFYLMTSWQSNSGHQLVSCETQVTSSLMPFHKLWFMFTQVLNACPSFEFIFILPLLNLNYCSFRRLQHMLVTKVTVWEKDWNWRGVVQVVLYDPMFNGTIRTKSCKYKWKLFPNSWRNLTYAPPFILCIKVLIKFVIFD